MRQACDELCGELDRVDHAALRVAGMRVEPLERDRHRIGREALPFELARAAAVERVGTEGAEPADVEMVRAAADLFVGRERHADGAVGNLGVRHQVLDGRDDLRHARLVVGAEQRAPGRCDDVVAGVGGERRILGGAQHGRGIVGQHQVAPVVGAVDDRADVVALHLRRRVDVREEADDRHVQLRRGCRDGRHHVAVLVHDHVGESDAPTAR